jgi:hypothetical protein
MKALANTLLVAAFLAVVSAIFGFSAWVIIAWFISIFAGIALFFVLLAAHRRLKKWQPYWWLWSSLMFPFDYFRTKKAVKTATDSALADAANLIFSAPKTWFTMRIIRVVGKAMNRRHKEMKTFERKHL